MCPFKISNTLTTTSNWLAFSSFECLEVDCVQASEDRLVLPFGHSVIVLASMSTSGQKTSMRTSWTCTFLHLPALCAERTVFTHIKPQVVRFVFPDGTL